uniref:Nonsense-mediated mRNA decay factor n=1 Tax=Xiphophorus couchianus TaxID=32473 RepID=A0A3B5L770_9TELE
MSGPGQDSEPEAKVLLIKRLYRAVVESVHKLDVIIGSKSSYREVFKPENISLRNKLRELCVKLMFLHPVDYGRKAEELLWRKVYYEVIQVIKTNKKHIHSRSALECAYRTHLIAGVGFYQHLLLYIQSHYQLELQDCIDWTHVTDPLIGRKKPVSASSREMEWAQMACHRCLVYLGDLARYQNELAGVEAEQLAERFYHQALSVMPHVGMPFNQLGTLAGSKFYNVEATYYYLRCIQSDTPFEGAYGNLKRLFDKAAKMYHQVKKQEMRKLSPSRQRSKDIKRVLVSFIYLQSLLQPKNSLMETELTSLCQLVLEDFNLVLFYLPAPTHGGAPPCPSEEEEEQTQHSDSSYPVLPDNLIFKMVVTCLMVVHSLKRGGSKQYSASIAFTLALFSHLVNHVNIRLQAELEDGESQVPALHTDAAAAEVDPSEERPLQNGSLEQEDEEDKDEDGRERVRVKKQSSEEDQHKAEEEKQRQKKKYTRLSRLRRRRCAHKGGQGEDESDLSEGFESEEDEDDDEGGRVHADSTVGTPIDEPLNPSSVKKETKRDGLGEEGSWESGSEEEEGGTAFDVETDSDMNSQESRSDLEDMEDTENSDSTEGQAREQQEEEEEQPKEEGGERDGEAPPSTNGPLTQSDSSISSNLQAMSSQLFQSKRCFRLAPTFSNMLLRPQAASGSTPTDTSAPPSQETPPPPGDSHCDLNPGTANGINDNGSVHLAFLDQTLRLKINSFEEKKFILLNEFILINRTFYLKIMTFILLIITSCVAFIFFFHGRNDLPYQLKLEVSQLEGSLQQPKAQSSMSPYLVPDAAALCHHLNLIRHLAGSGCFIIIIPRTVIDGLDRLKKENGGARDGIRFLESEFRKGNRYIRCQKESGRTFERDKLKRQDIEAWHLYKMVDSCRQLTVSQSNGDEDTAGMVTILTGHEVDELCARSAAMKSATQAVSSAGMELKNIVEFYRQWKEIG